MSIFNQHTLFWGKIPSFTLSVHVLSLFSILSSQNRISGFYLKRNLDQIWASFPLGYSDCDRDTANRWIPWFSIILFTFSDDIHQNTVVINQWAWTLGVYLPLVSCTESLSHIWSLNVLRCSNASLYMPASTIT